MYLLHRALSDSVTLLIYEVLLMILNQARDLNEFLKEPLPAHLRSLQPAPQPLTSTRVLLHPCRWQHLRCRRRGV